MGQRINTRNFENGQDKNSIASWKKFFTRHWQFATKEELLAAWNHVPEAVKAIEKTEKNGYFEYNESEPIK